MTQKRKKITNPFNVVTKDEESHQLKRKAAKLYPLTEKALKEHKEGEEKNKIWISYDEKLCIFITASKNNLLESKHESFLDASCWVFGSSFLVAFSLPSQLLGWLVTSLSHHSPIQPSSHHQHI